MFCTKKTNLRFFKDNLIFCLIEKLITLKIYEMRPFNFRGLKILCYLILCEVYNSIKRFKPTDLVSPSCPSEPI